jgi:DNA-binding MarR family transcriptional regulator
MHLFLDINKRIRTYCQGKLRYSGPGFRMRAMQKAPSQSLDSTACNCLALRQAARHVTQIYDSYLASEGLRTTQYSILSKLNRLGPLSINELAKSMVMDRTTLGRAIRPLERDRLLMIGEGEDGRTRSLRLTAKGEARLKAAAPKWREAQKEFETTFGARDAAQLRDVLQRVVSVN